MMFFPQYPLLIAELTLLGITDFWESGKIANLSIKIQSFLL